MDIREWLQNTADREPPDERVETAFPAFLQPKPDPAQPKRRSRQKRKRPSSDPPVPTHRPSRGRRRPAQSSRSDQARPTGNRPVATSSHSSSSSRSGSSQSTGLDRRQGPVETFHRRARHKTRPDRYESKPKRRKKDPGSTRRKKPESRRRRSHRSGDGARTTGLVQSFQLKHGPKNHRLTLKPDASAGIFKNGRASGPVATSGPGLPDLVFNEMRFLRRPKEHQDELVVDESTRQSKKTRRQFQEEEISSYFNRNQLEKQAGLAKPEAVPTLAARESVAQRPPELDLGPPKHPVELPEKPFLGFGSRGPPQEGVESHVPSNSCYTWSESVAARRCPPSGNITTLAFNPANERSNRRDMQPSQVSNTSLPASKAEVAKPQQQQHQSPSRSGHGVGSRGANPPALVKVYQPPGPTERSKISAIDESSEPLPGCISRCKGAELAEMNSRWETGSYHTSDILKIRDTINEAQRPQPLTGGKDIGQDVLEKENNDHATSTPMSERLRHVFGEVTKPSETGMADTPAAQPRAEREEHTHVHTKPLVMGRAQSHGYGEIDPSPPRWEMPKRGFSRTSDALRSLYGPPSRLTTATRPNSQQWQPFSRPVPLSANRSYCAVDEEEMLDILPDANLFRPPRDYIDDNTRGAEGLVRRLESNQQSRFPPQPGPDHYQPIRQYDSAAHQEELMGPGTDFEPTSFGPTGFVPTSFEPELFFLPSPRLGDEVSGRQLLSDGLQGGQKCDNRHREMVNPELASFWRPNVLY